MSAIPKDAIPIEVLNERLSYDPLTGIMTWKSTAWNQSHLLGKVAAGSDSSGYLRVKIGGNQSLSHRIAWAMYYGEYPSGYIDHINCNKLDNRIENLRKATLSEQQHNKAIQSNNTSGYKGVTWNEKRQEWLVRIAVNGK